MSMKASIIRLCKCKRPGCGHIWWPKFADKPKICPKCKSKYWMYKGKVRQSRKVSKNV
jgi:hypothetical protein